MTIPQHINREVSFQTQAVSDTWCINENRGLNSPDNINWLLGYYFSWSSIWNPTVLSFKVRLVLLHKSTFLSPLLYEFSQFCWGQSSDNNEQQCSGDFIYTFISSLEHITTYLSVSLLRCSIFFSHCSMGEYRYQDCWTQLLFKSGTWAWKSTVCTCAWTPARIIIFQWFTPMLTDKVCACACVCAQARVCLWRWVADGLLFGNNCWGELAQPS